MRPAAWYDSLASEYGDRFKQKLYLAEDMWLRVKFEQLYVRGEGLLLDVGYGSGQFLTTISTWPASRYIGFDVSEQMVIRARAGFPKYFFFVQDMEEPLLSLPSAYYRAISSLYAPFNYSLSPRQTLQEVQRLLHPYGTGMFHIVGPRYDFRQAEIQNGGNVPYIRYTPQSIEDLFRVYFGFVEITPFGLIVDYLPSWLSVTQFFNLLCWESKLPIPAIFYYSYLVVFREPLA